MLHVMLADSLNNFLGVNNHKLFLSEYLTSGGYMNFLRNFDRRTACLGEFTFMYYCHFECCLELIC